MANEAGRMPHEAGRMEGEERPKRRSPADRTDFDKPAQTARDERMQRDQAAREQTARDPADGGRMDRTGADRDRQRDGSESHTWDNPIETLRREWDRAVESFPSRWPFGRMNAENESFWRRQFGRHNEPAVDVMERGDRYEICAELPGVDENDVEVKLANGVLVIRGEKHGERQEKRKDYFLSERTFGTFQRSLRVPDGVDADRVEASFANGVLTVTLPKTSEAQQREKRIPIKSKSRRAD